MSSPARNDQYWYIHGETYDLKSFCNVHPGGKIQLLNLQGRDCTEMVHSMHSLVSIEKVQTIMQKYKVNGIDAPKHDSEIFTWNGDCVHSTLTKKVREYFDIQKYNSSAPAKADFKFWLICAIEYAIQLTFMYWWIIQGSLFSGFMSGVLIVSLSFMIFHTAGHCGISTSPKVNKFWYTLISNYVVGFIDTIWHIHHNYAHHGYTNIYKKDPDVMNAISIIRKCQQQQLRPQHKFQTITVSMLVFFPNQWFGQVIQYFISTFKHKIFGFPMLTKAQSDKTPFYIYFAIIFAVAATITGHHGVAFTLLSMWLYGVGSGFMYWGLTFPNHDTELSEHTTVEEAKNLDWGEHQIRHSSNFKIPDVLSYFIGGMNYQIEHHLFPTVHPRHYPAISKFVKEECQKRNIPYHLHTSWFDAGKGYFRHLVAMSKNEDQSLPTLLNF